MTAPLDDSQQAATVQAVNVAKQAVSGPVGPSPLRRADSIRRTSSVDMFWPDGPGTQLQLRGHARDAVTASPADAPSVVAVATTDVGIGQNRQIERIIVTPERAGAARLVGARGGGHLRSALDEALPGERESGHPLYLLLDDISGTSLIAGFALMRWPDLIGELIASRGGESGPAARPARPNMEGVCIGFAPGSSSLDEQTSGQVRHRVQQVVSPVRPDDPDGWHELPVFPTIGARRSRRIDVWRDEVDGDAVIRVDSWFQDSAADPEQGRIAIHEYLLQATVDPDTMTLLSVDPDPRVLPFMECPSAVINARAMAGSPIGELRTTVLDRLGRTNGCTHLNDALRALAEVPVLLNDLDSSLPNGRGHDLGYERDA